MAMTEAQKLARRLRAQKRRAARKGQAPQGAEAVATRLAKGPSDKRSTPLEPMHAHARVLVEGVHQSGEIQRLVDYLAHRWNDERECGDIEDYSKKVQLSMPSDVEVIEMHKRPFGFTVRVLAQYDVKFTMSLKGLFTWTRLT